LTQETYQWLKFCIRYPGSDLLDSSKILSWKLRNNAVYKLMWDGGRKKVDDFTKAHMWKGQMGPPGRTRRICSVAIFSVAFHSAKDPTAIAHDDMDGYDVSNGPWKSHDCGSKSSSAEQAEATPSG